MPSVRQEKRDRTIEKLVSWRAFVEASFAGRVLCWTRRNQNTSIGCCSTYVRCGLSVELKKNRLPRNAIPVPMLCKTSLLHPQNYFQGPNSLKYNSHYIDIELDYILSTARLATIFCSAARGTIIICQAKT
jgi:hypothetical protein